MMFQRGLLISSLALSLGLLDIAAPAAPLKPSKAAHQNGEAAFQMVVPAELEQVVTVRPSWLLLSKQLDTLQDATKVPLTRAPSTPDDPIFVAAPGRSEFALLRQMRLLLTDDQWQSQWAYKEIGKDHRSYRLWREAVSPQERRAKMAQAARERLAKVLALLAAGPQTWDATRQEDPDLSGRLRQPVYQAPLLLAGELSSDQLDGVLSGVPLTLRVAEMSPQDQALARQATVAIPTDNFGMRVTNTITGETHLAFDMKHLPTTGEILFQSQPLGDDPGTLGLSMTIFTEAAHEMGAGGDEMLYPNDPDFAQDEKQKISAHHRGEAAGILALKTPGAKTVTIDAATKPQEGEPQLAAYLRAFAEQTKLTVLAHWPQDSKALTDSKGLPKKLPASIISKPAGEVLDILCQTYGGEWVQDETTVRLRALPDKETDAKKPTAGMPAATGVSASPPPQPVKAL